MISHLSAFCVVFMSCNILLCLNWEVSVTWTLWTLFGFWNKNLYQHFNPNIPTCCCLKPWLVWLCSPCSWLIDRNMTVSTSQHWTNTQNLRAAKSLSPLISQPTFRPGSSQTTPNPKPRASKRAHLRLRRANRGEGRSIFHKAAAALRAWQK